MPLNLQQGYGGGGAVDALRYLREQAFKALQEQHQTEEAQARLQEQARESNQQHEINLTHVKLAQIASDLAQKKNEQELARNALLDPVDIAAKKATTAETEQKTHQLGITFDQGQADRAAAQLAIAAMPEGPAR